MLMGFDAISYMGCFFFVVVVTLTSLVITNLFLSILYRQVPSSYPAPYDPGHFLA